MQPPSTSPARRPQSPVPASWPMGGQRYPSARQSGQHDLTGHGSQAPRTTSSARITASAPSTTQPRRTADIACQAVPAETTARYGGRIPLAPDRRFSAAQSWIGTCSGRMQIGQFGACRVEKAELGWQPAQGTPIARRRIAGPCVRTDLVGPAHAVRLNRTVELSHRFESDCCWPLTSGLPSGSVPVIGVSGDLMKRLVEFSLDEGGSVLVEVDEPSAGSVVRGSGSGRSTLVEKADKTFEDAIAAVMPAARSLTSRGCGRSRMRPMRCRLVLACS